MSQVTQYSSLYPHMLLELPGAAQRVEILLQALQKAGYEFARFTESYIDDLEPIPIVEYQRDYTLSPPTSTSIQRILGLWVNSNPRDYRTYQLKDGNILRFASQSVPNNLDDTMVQCGTAGEDDYTVWATITDGSVVIPLAGTDNSIEDLDFSDVTSMDDVALVIQTGLRAESENNEGFVEWFSTRFVVYTKSGDIEVLEAGASGTDISGASYMNGLTGVATAAPMLDLNLAFLPDITTDVLPDWYLNRYQRFIVAGAMVDLASMPKQPWFSEVTQAKYLAIWNEGLGDAKMDVDRMFKDGDLEISA